jgi:hypothetical protein
MIIGFIYINVIFRILAPTTYIFFASAIPVISFGEQLERNTGINMNSARNFFFFLLLNILFLKKLMLAC